MANKKTIEEIIEIYERYKMEDVFLGTEIPLDVIDFKPSVDDLNAFCEIVPKIREKRYETSLGWYLTALIQKCDNKKITLNLPIPLNSLGHGLENKRIIVNGSVGDLGFMYSYNCSVKIKGDVGDYFGYIANGCSFRIIEGEMGKKPLELARNCKLKLQKYYKGVS